MIPLNDEAAARRIAALCADLHDEYFFAREGYRLAMRGLLALIAIGVARLAASRARTGSVTLAPADATVNALRKLVEEHFRKDTIAGFLRREACHDGRPAQRSRPKRATGVTAGHMIRQRVLTEAKRQLVFTSQPIHEISYDLAFSDPSHLRASSASRPARRRRRFREGRAADAGPIASRAAP